jgi:hypothetical protein
MRNRAKCKLCNSIIESFHRTDYVTCNCGEICLDGGPELLKCFANDYLNFLRVDDEGNEIIVTFLKDGEKEQSKESEVKEEKSVTSRPTKKELISMLDEMIKSYENLPPNAMYSNPTHFDIYSALLLVLALFRAED